MTHYRLVAYVQPMAHYVLYIAHQEMAPTVNTLAGAGTPRWRRKKRERPGREPSRIRRPARSTEESHCEQSQSVRLRFSMVGSFDPADDLRNYHVPVRLSGRQNVLRDPQGGPGNRPQGFPPPGPGRVRLLASSGHAHQQVAGAEPNGRAAIAARPAELPGPPGYASRNPRSGKNFAGSNGAASQP